MKMTVSALKLKWPLRIISVFIYVAQAASISQSKTLEEGFPERGVTLEHGRRHDEVEGIVVNGPRLTRESTISTPSPASISIPI